MVNIGIVGLGFMGQTHFKRYAEIAGAKVVAIADLRLDSATGELPASRGNIGTGPGAAFSTRGLFAVTDFRELLQRPDIDVIDICVPTNVHTEIALAAVESGKHVLCEKPMALSAADASRIADAARKSKGFFMPAMCMRFWPQWAWLKRAVDAGAYGPVRSATFRRVASMPGGWFGDGALSGGAILDLHIHDTDFVCHLFGPPKGVFSRGYSKTTEQVDHVVTHYLYDSPAIVTAEGGWCMANGFGFTMRYTVNFEHATADFDLGRKDSLLLHQDGKTQPVACEPSDGWMEELRYFVQSVATNRRPQTVTADDAVQSMKVIDAERESVGTGCIVMCGRQSP